MGWEEIKLSQWDSLLSSRELRWLQIQSGWVSFSTGVTVCFWWVAVVFPSDPISVVNKGVDCVIDEVLSSDLQWSYSQHLTSQRPEHWNLVSKAASKPLQNVTAGKASQIFPSWVPPTQDLGKLPPAAWSSLGVTNLPLCSQPFAHGCVDEDCLVVYVLPATSEMNIFKRISVLTFLHFKW